MTDPYDPRISITGSGAPLVLVPGMDGTGLLFYRQVPLLARRHRVATYALRDDAKDMETLVADLAAVIGVVAGEGQPATVVGESFGGALAMSLALAHPALVDRLVIVNSFPYFAPQFRLRLARVAIALTPWGAMRLVRGFTATRLHSSHTHREEIHRFLELTAQSTRRGYLSRLRVLRTYDVRPRLHELRPPVLFVAADQDHLVPAVAQAREMASRVPGGAVRVLDGHGHICLIAPDVDLAALLVEWQTKPAR